MRLRLPAPMKTHERIRSNQWRGIVALEMKKIRGLLSCSLARALSLKESERASE
jgi:hypothetical protein